MMTEETPIPPTTANTTNTSVCVNFEASSINDFLMAVYILTFIFGLTFNLFTLGPIILKVRRRKALGIFLISLAISDLLYIFTLPPWINYYHQNHKWMFSVESCRVAGFFFYSNMYISIFLLCCISVDRCLLVTLPIYCRNNQTRRYFAAWIQCSVVYVIVILIFVIVLLTDGLKDVHDDKTGRCYETYPMSKAVATLNLIRVVGGILLPLMVLACSYGKVFSTVHARQGLSPKVKRKVRLFSYGVIGIFSVCFAPYHILLLIRSLVRYSSTEESYCQFEQKMHFFFSCTLALSSLNCVVDPVLYILATERMQEDLKMCWRKRT